MIEHLVWLDKNWKKRGYANNNHLYVNHSNKTYKLVVTYTNTDFVIEVKSKQDLFLYIQQLKYNGYTECS